MKADFHNKTNKAYCYYWMASATIMICLHQLKTAQNKRMILGILESKKFTFYPALIHTVSFSYLTFSVFL